MENDNYLVHYGVLGQKWGIRRYQNYDGTYTKRGLARYNKSKEVYDEAKSLHKQTKELYKEGKKNGYSEAPDGTKFKVEKSVVRQARGKVRSA